jgi:periplasmic divalent cation tolerance protein
VSGEADGVPGGEPAAGAADGSPAVADRVLVVLTTVADAGQAQRLAQALVTERLAACVTVLAPARSTYRWQGAVESADEVPLLVKTTAARWPALRERLRALHPYDVPEMLVLPAADGWPDYLAWVRASVSVGGPEGAADG